MAQVTHTGNGNVSNTNNLGYSFTFPSLSESAIRVSVNNVDKTVTTDYTIHNWTEAGNSNAYILFTSATARGTGNVRIYRHTDGSLLRHIFQAGSSIKADDLNRANLQALYLAEEAREYVNNLANAGSPILINGDNLTNGSITSDHIVDGTVDSNDLKAGAVGNSQLDASVTAAIAANTAKVTNATHTGEVTGSTALTITDRAVDADNLADNAVTTRAIKDGEITRPKIAPGNITDVELATTLGQNADIPGRSGAFTAADLTVNDQGRVVAISSGTIATSEIENGAVTLEKISAAAQSSLTGTSVIKSITAGGLATVQSISSTAYTDRVSLTVNTAANSRVLVFVNFSIISDNDSVNANGKLTTTNGSFIGGDLEVNTFDTWLDVNRTLLDISPYEGTRTYKIQWNSSYSTNTADIKNAWITAIEF